MQKEFRSDDVVLNVWKLVLVRLISMASLIVMNLTTWGRETNRNFAASAVETHYLPTDVAYFTFSSKGMLSSTICNGSGLAW